MKPPPINPNYDPCIPQQHLFALEVLDVLVLRIRHIVPPAIFPRSPVKLPIPNFNLQTFLFSKLFPHFRYADRSLVLLEKPSSFAFLDVLCSGEGAILVIRGKARPDLVERESQSYQKIFLGANDHPSKVSGFAAKPLKKQDNR